MPAPSSLVKAGFLTYEQVKKRRGLLIGTEGKTDAGKTEFILSSNGPGGVICVDRNFESCMKNPNPPKARQPDFMFRLITVPLAGTAKQADFLQYWTSFRKEFYDLLDNREIHTIAVDGDSDTWELQRLAAFGKLTQIPSIMYADVNAARRALIARARDSGRIVITTNKVKDEYVDKVDTISGQVVEKDGKAVRVKSGEVERQGFGDQDYLYDIQLLHLYEPGKETTITKGPRAGEKITSIGRWGIRFLKCKSRMELIGSELWGEEANFKGVVKLAFPQIAPEEWGL